MAGGSIVREVGLRELLTKSKYATTMDQLKNAKSGLLRNFLRRMIIAQDDPWWETNHSPWKISIEHPIYPTDSVSPDYWFERAMDLCENEITHQYFGLTLQDIMTMDVATFVKIETRLRDFTKRQSDRLSPKLKEELKKK